MMFKVGDKVRVKEEWQWGYTDEFNAAIHTVLGCYRVPASGNRLEIAIRFNPNERTYTYNVEEFELVRPKYELLNFDAIEQKD